MPKQETNDETILTSRREIAETFRRWGERYAQNSQEFGADPWEDAARHPLNAEESASAAEANAETFLSILASFA